MSINPMHAWAVLRRYPRPGWLVVARLLQWSGLSRLLTIQQDGYRLRFYSSNTSANLWLGAGRVHGLALFRDYCRPGEIAVDVGANIGEVSILLSQAVGAAGQVYCFEPNPRVFRYLRGNLRLNRCENVDARNRAVGAVAGAVRMSDSKWDDMNRITADGGLSVPGSTLDAELPATAPIALMKIDVEGSELQVLEGGRTALARTACVNCEMGEAHYRRYGYGMGDLIRFLREAGFQTFVESPARTLRAVDDHFAGEGGYELVAIRDLDDFVMRTKWQVR